MLSNSLKLVPRTALRFMSTLPIAPPQTFYFQDNHNKRQKAAEPFTLPDGRQVRFEIATIDDVELAVKQLLLTFVNQTGMYQALGSTEDEFYDFFIECCKTCVAHDGTILGFIGDDLVTIWVTKYYAKEEIVKNFGRRALPNEKPVFETLPDYGAAFDACEAPNRNLKIVQILFESFEQQFGKFLPNDLEKICIDDAVFVHSGLKGTKLGSRVIEVSQEIARKKGCNYTGMVTVARASQILAEKKGYDVSVLFPLNKFLIHGERPIQNTIDGLTDLSLVIKKI